MRKLTFVSFLLLMGVTIGCTLALKAAEGMIVSRGVIQDSYGPYKGVPVGDAVSKPLDVKNASSKLYKDGSVDWQPAAKFRQDTGVVL